MSRVTSSSFILKETKTGTSRQAFLHFNKWYNNNASKSLQRSVLDESINAKIVYDDPKYWPILQNKNPVKVKPLSSYESNINNLEISLLKEKVQTETNEYKKEMNEMQRSINEMKKLYDTKIKLLEQENTYFKNILED